MAITQHNQELDDVLLREYEMKREDAMDCFHSIIDLVKKHFAKDDSYFVVWLNVCYEVLKKRFDYEMLLRKITFIKDIINHEMNPGAFNNIDNLINTIYELKL